jgi:xanthine dehydrogenase accessory factor
LNRSLLKLVDEEVDRGGAGVLCTVVGADGSTPRDLGASMWVRPDGSIAGTIGGGPLEYAVIGKALAALKSSAGPILHKAVLREAESGGEAVCGGDVVILMEPLGKEAEVVVFGAGHVGKALARMASAAGFRVCVWDEREEFANPEAIPWGKVVACPLGEVQERGLALHGSSYVVVVTRGHALDSEVVRWLEGRAMAYLGLIGSRKKIAATREKLLGQGVSQGHLDRIFQPVGLPIGAETPEEIAVSVLAEIIAVHRGADMAKLRCAFGNVPGPFYPSFDGCKPA